MTDDQLRALGKQLPHDRPDAARRDAVRSALLVAATETARPPARRRWLVVGTAFATGALAAAAIALVLVRARPQHGVDLPAPAQIVASGETRFEHEVVATATGVDEILHVHGGTVRITAEHPRRGDRVRLQTRDAEVQGAGVYEATVVDDRLGAVTVRSGSAEIKVTGQHTVILSAGQTWRASIITADLTADLAADLATDRSGPSAVTDTGAHRTDTANSADSAVPSADPGRAAATDRAADTADPSGRPAPDKAVRPADAVRAADKAVRPADAVRAADTAVRPADTADRTGRPAGDTARPADAVRAADAASTAPAASPGAEPGVEGARLQDGTAKAAARGRSPIELRFQAGWTLLKQGRAREAAAELGAAADTAPADPLAADARYFQAVALVRAGERAQAERVLVAFLDHAPRSLRRGRAAVLLGRLIGERGELAAARAWLESAVADPDPAIASAAKAGLQALEAQRKR